MKTNTVLSAKMYYFYPYASLDWLGAVLCYLWLLACYLMALAVAVFFLCSSPGSCWGSWLQLRPGSRYCMPENGPHPHVRAAPIVYSHVLRVQHHAVVYPSCMTFFAVAKLVMSVHSLLCTTDDVLCCSQAGDECSLLALHH